MNSHLYLKRMYHLLSNRNTESIRNDSNCKLYSTASSNRYTSPPQTVKQDERANATDFKAFKAKLNGDLKESLDCFQLVRLPYPISFVTNTDLLKLSFCPLSYPIKDLIRYSKSIIQSNNERKSIGKSFNLLKLIEIIAKNYHVTAYHNFTHAFSVMLLIFQSYSRSERLQNMLSQRQWFYVFIAALIHDINHPGTTNAFEVNAGSQLASEAGNQAVLEKMHLSTFWKLLKGNSQVNFLQGYSVLEGREIKKLITRMVMSTDASRHPQAVEGLRYFKSERKPLRGENALFLVEQLFHGCDIGNPCLPFEMYMNWSVLITYELDRVAAREQQLGLEVTSPLRYEGMQNFYRGQLSFTSGVVVPLWKGIYDILPELEEVMRNITDNVEELCRRIETF